MALEQQPRKTMVNPSDAPQPTVQRGRGFIHEVMVELKKTTWPTLPEAWRLTTVVLGVIVSIAIYLAMIGGAVGFVMDKLIRVK